MGYDAMPKLDALVVEGTQIVAYRLIRQIGAGGICRRSQRPAAQMRKCGEGADACCHERIALMIEG